MGRRFKNRAIFVAEEPAYGTDAMPDGTDAVLCATIDVTPLNIEYAERELVRPYYGNFSQLAAAKSVQMTLEVEMAGSGTAGTAPAWGKLMKACGLEETVNVGVDVRYAPTSGQEDTSVTIYFYLDGILHAALGCRGTVSHNVEARGRPTFTFAFTGIYVPVTDMPAPDPSTGYAAYQRPLPANKENTPVWTLDGYDACLQTFTFDSGRNVVYRNLIGCESVLVTDAAASGTAVFELPLTATQDYWSDIAAGSETIALAFEHGITAGNIVRFESSNVQITEPTISEQDMIAMLNVNLLFIPSGAGDNDYLYIVK